jgi:DNA-binding winged helix-turn-helix (wHTH) protein
VSKIYEIGPFRLDEAAEALTKAATVVALGSRAIAVLSALVARADQFVSKASLMDAAWPGLIVEENNLAVQISAIRRALAETPGGRTLDRNTIAARLSIRRSCERAAGLSSARADQQAVESA